MSKVKGSAGHKLSEGPRENAVASVPASVGPRHSLGVAASLQSLVFVRLSSLRVKSPFPSSQNDAHR